jgi:hypothetical protein
MIAACFPLRPSRVFCSSSLHRKVRAHAFAKIARFADTDCYSVTKPKALARYHTTGSVVTRDMVERILRGEFDFLLFDSRSGQSLS